MLVAFADVVFRRTLFAYDAEMGFRARPYVAWNGEQTNGFGFLDDDYPPERPPGTYRILAVSDSFGWIGGKGHNYTKVLERRFDATLGLGRVEVINAGYPGTHTGEELAMLRRLGLRYRPDLVVLAFFVGNDILDANPRRRRVALGAGEVDIDPETDREVVVFGQPVILKDGWRFQSRLLVFLRNQRAIWRHLSVQPPAAAPPIAAGAPAAMGGAAARGLTMFPDEYLRLEGARMLVARREAPGYVEDAETFALGNLRGMRDLLAARRIGFLVFLIPDEFQVDAGLRRAVLRQHGWRDADFDWARPQARLMDFCAAESLECVDLLPLFKQAHAAGQRLYLPNDSHWNEAGIDLAAQALFERLKDQVGDPETR